MSDVRTELQQIREALRGMGGHSHWNEGGAGGRCAACERNAELRADALAALAWVEATLNEQREWIDRNSVLMTDMATAAEAAEARVVAAEQSIRLALDERCDLRWLNETARAALMSVPAPAEPPREEPLMLPVTCETHGHVRSGVSTGTGADDMLWNEWCDRCGKHLPTPAEPPREEVSEPGRQLRPEGDDAARGEVVDADDGQREFESLPSHRPGSLTSPAPAEPPERPETP